MIPETSIPTKQRYAPPIELLHDAIRACERCVVSGHIACASPRAWGIAPAPFMVIGQAPSIREVGTGGELYLGPAGMKLRGWLRDSGFTDADFGVSVYMTALTKCFPGRLPGISKDRAPSKTELAQCRPWLDHQIKLVEPRVIILFGKMAIDAFLGRNLPLDECIGQTYERDGVLYLPLPHSSGASTWLNDPSHRAQTARAIGLLAAIRREILED